MSTDGHSGDIFIYGQITKYAWEEFGEVSSITFKKELDALGDDVETINLYVNSPGGSVFEGLAIGNMLKRHKAKVNAFVDALAASIASVIIMKADTISMPKNSMLMVHNPWTFTMGNAAELRKEADDLDRIGKASTQDYLEKAGDKLSEEKLKELLDAETWLSADEAFQYGLCDVVLEENNTAASISEDLFAEYKNVPKQLNEKVNQKENAIPQEELERRKKIAETAKNHSAYINEIIGGI